MDKELQVTDLHRNAIDLQIRTRFEDRLIKKLRSGDVPDDFPVTAVIGARAGAGLGIHLEKACPYFRDCDRTFPDLCPAPAYRGCPSYKIRVAGEIMDGSIDLAAAGLVTA